MSTQPANAEEQAEPWQMMAAGVLVAVIVGLIIWILPAVIPELALNANVLAGEKAAWYLTRSSGLVAYLLLSASTIWGLLLSTKLVKAWVPPAISLAMHNYISWLSLGLTIFHAGVLLFDSYYTYTLSALLIPFTGPYSPLWVGMGTLGFYIMLLTTLSYYVRKQIGQKMWRKLHYTTFGGYVLATVHGLMAGTDAMQLLSVFGGSSFLVLFLTLYRILSSGSAETRRPRKAVARS
ncbi:MAG: hypothetical protein ACPG8W_23890 [Candidatus Promineifilaceae bacterium]